MRKLPHKKLMDENELNAMIEGGNSELLPDKEYPFFLSYSDSSRMYDKYQKNRPGDPTKVIKQPPLQSFLRKNYQRYTFEYVLEGNGFLEINQKAYQIKANDIYILPAGHNHFYYPEGDYWIKLFFICRGVLPSHLLSAYGLHEQYHFSNCRKMKIYFEKMYDIFRKGSPDIHVEGALLLHHLIADLFAQTAKHPENFTFLPVHKIRAEIQAGIKEKLDIASLAEKFGISEWYLTKIFKRWMGITPYEYYLERKIELACDMLSCKEYSISEIALELKFADPFHFSKTFKKKKGITPSEFRKNLFQS